MLFISPVSLVAEALHEARIAEIAAQIAAEPGRVRLVLVAGPSASGKTSFAKRVAVQLLARGRRPFPLSLDDYYLLRERVCLGGRTAGRTTRAWPARCRGRSAIAQHAFEHRGVERQLHSQALPRLVERRELLQAPVDLGMQRAHLPALFLDHLAARDAIGLHRGEVAALVLEQGLEEVVLVAQRLGGLPQQVQLVGRAAMNPIATTLTPQPSVDLASGEETLTQYERSDFCPVPRAVRILESAVAFVLAQALLEKLGGDSLDEMRPRFEKLRRARLPDLPMDGGEHVFWPEE